MNRATSRSGVASCGSPGDRLVPGAAAPVKAARACARSAPVMSPAHEANQRGPISRMGTGTPERGSSASPSSAMSTVRC